MKNAVLWDVTPCGSGKNRRFGGTYRLHHQGGLVPISYGRALLSPLLQAIIDIFTQFAERSFSDSKLTGFTKQISSKRQESASQEQR
jgi:hypothetical protein